jgi:hypothetical protein
MRAKPLYLQQISANPVGIYRSKLEQRFAREWAKDWPNHPANYEPFRLKVPGRGTYLPDFVLPESRMIVEVKPCPSFIDWDYLWPLIVEMSKSGWLFACWSGMPREDIAMFYAKDDWRKPMRSWKVDTGWTTPWTLVDGPRRFFLDEDHDPDQLPPISDLTERRLAGNVTMTACESCGRMSPDWGRTVEGWVGLCHSPKPRFSGGVCHLDDASEYEIYGANQFYGCFGCGGKVHKSWDFDGDWRKPSWWLPSGEDAFLERHVIKAAVQS